MTGDVIGRWEVGSRLRHLQPRCIVAVKAHSIKEYTRSLHCVCVDRSHSSALVAAEFAVTTYSLIEPLGLPPGKRKAGVTSSGSRERRVQCSVIEKSIVFFAVVGGVYNPLADTVVDFVSAIAVQCSKHGLKAGKRKRK